MSIGEEVYELADILYKNKEYNLLWHDCIYLADQIVERIHNMDKKNIKTTDWLARGMTKEQIARKKEEAIMAADLELCYTERMGVSKFYPDYDAIAERMYEIGYRKPVEAEWGGINGDTCSNCNTSLGDIMDGDSYYRPSFEIKSLVACPYCGARMRKGE